MSGERRRRYYGAGDDALTLQALRTVGSLRADPGRTEAVYAPLGWDALGLADRLEAARTRLLDALAARQDATSEHEEARGKKRAAAKEALKWVHRLERRLEGARRAGEVGDLRLPPRPRSVRADRPDSVVDHVRRLRPELPRARAALTGGDALDAFFAEGERLADALDAADAVVHRWDEAERQGTRVVEAAREEIVALLRTLDLWVEDARASGVEEVPGAERDVVHHAWATRPRRGRAVRGKGRRRAEGGDAAAEAPDAGVEGSDAGAEASDAGAEGGDAGAEAPDAGAEMGDAGAEAPDAGVEGGDAGAEGGDAARVTPFFMRVRPT